MASKVETRAAIAALAAELGVTTPDLEGIERLDQLEPILTELQAKKAALSPPPAPEAPPAESASPAEQSPPAEVTYEVAPGKTLTTLRGKRFGGAPVTARDFPGGETTLADWLAKGFVKVSESAAQ